MSGYGTGKWYIDYPIMILVWVIIKIKDVIGFFKRRG